MSQIAIIGAGAWGTALSIVLGRKGRHQVRLWVYEQEVRDSIKATRENALFLPGHKIPDAVLPSGELAEVLAGAEIVVSAMPSQHCRKLFTNLCSQLRPEMLIVSATKGLEEQSLLRMSEVIGEITKSHAIDCRIGALSGPTFAAEVARGDPTAIAIASKSDQLGPVVQRE